MLAIFFLMPIMVITTMKLAQYNVSSPTIIAIIDQDSSSGYQLNDSFDYATIGALQSNWDYNESSNVYLNITDTKINFTSSTLLAGESMYFQRDFNNISSLHNEILIGSCDTYIINGTLTAFTASSFGMMIGSDFLTTCAVSFSYGNITAINGSSSTVLMSVDNDSLYQIEMNVFLKNYTYQVTVNGSDEGTFSFALNLSTINAYQSYIYPSASMTNSVNVLLDNLSITVNATPTIDLSATLVDYMRNESTMVHYTSVSDAQNDLKLRIIHGYVVIHDGFETNLTQDLPVEIDVVIDSTNRHKPTEVLDNVNVAIGNFRTDHDFVLDAVITDVISEFSNTIPVGPLWMGLLIPSLISIAFFGSAMITTAPSIVDDVPLQRLLLAPLKRNEVVIAKFLSYIIFSVLQILSFLVIWLVLFPLIGLEQVVMGSIIDCFIVMFVVSILGISLGFAVSSISKTKLQANQGFLTVFVFILTLWMMQVTPYDPMTQGEIALIGIMYKGLTFPQILPQVLMLLLYAIIALIVTFIIFSRKKTLV